MRTLQTILYVSFCLFTAATLSAQTAPAMIGQGPGSVASRLHYPDSAKKSKTEGGVQFYCEVGADGRARHIRALAESAWSALRFTVKNAVEQGRFIPARANGRPTPVMIGGTVFFLMSNGQP